MYQVDGLITGSHPMNGATAQNAWRDWCCDIHGTFDMSFGSDSYRGRVVRQRTSTYQLLSWTSEAELITRSASGIRRDPRGIYELLVPLKGTFFIGSDSADQRIEPGAIVLVPVDLPFTVAHDRGAAALTLLVPYERLEHRLAPGSERGLCILGEKGLPRVCRDLLVSLLHERSAVSGAEFDSVCDRVVDLFCLALAGDSRLPESSAHAVLDAVRRHVRQHVTDPELSVAATARAIGWSPRYVQALLAQLGTSPSELIRTERLELARARLANPAFASRSIASIAASVGFSSPSAFASAYRRHFGYSPRETRSAWRFSA